MKTAFASVILLIFVLLIESCMKPAPVPIGGYQFQINYQNKNGADLFNPNTPGHYTIDSTEVFDINSRKNKTDSLALSTIPNYYGMQCHSFICQSSQSIYSVQFFIVPQNNVKGALVRFNSTEADTLSYDISLTTKPGSVGYEIHKIYYKGQVLWSDANRNNNTMTIVK
ncbi:MAG: hypothetical protein JST48_08845 [Bacteroidetes bacterium]|nr:hypothetical protein [Bacteroidota bacterium]